jgi:hypothetical protein
MFRQHARPVRAAAGESNCGGKSRGPVAAQPGVGREALWAMLAQHPAQGELDLARAERWPGSMRHERNAELKCPPSVR